MRDVVICHPLRTPVGRYGGALRDVRVQDLAATAITALLEGTGIDPEVVDDVVLGQGYPNGEAPALGRVAWLDAGGPSTVPGAQVDRRCGSGLQAVLDGAMRVQTGVCDVVVAGGAESMSNVEHATTGARWGTRGGAITLEDRLSQGRITAGGRNHPVPGGMVETAENLRARTSITRERQDTLAVRSHERAVAAQQAGRFDQELVPVAVPARRGEHVSVTADEHPRADTTLDALAGLRPILGRSDPDATVTAGNASGQNDGAAVCLVTTVERADELGLRPLARLRGWTVSGVEPATMGIGPVPAIRQLLERQQLDLDQIDLIEINEAFAVQLLAVTDELGLDAMRDERINPNGSGISLGHPIGATGARILATMLYELERRQGRYALESMCIGGGQGLAALFERV